MKIQLEDIVFKLNIDLTKKNLQFDQELEKSDIKFRLETDGIISKISFLGMEVFHSQMDEDLLRKYEDDSENFYKHLHLRLKDMMKRVKKIKI